MIFMIGTMIEVLGSGFLADAIGRTKSLVIADILAVITSFGYFFTGPMWLFLITRFCSGLVAAIFTSINASLAYELLPEQKSALTGYSIYSYIAGALLIVGFMIYIP